MCATNPTQTTTNSTTLIMVIKRRLAWPSLKQMPNFQLTMLVLRKLLRPYKTIICSSLPKIRHRSWNRMGISPRTYPCHWWAEVRITWRICEATSRMRGTNQCKILGRTKVWPALSVPAGKRRQLGRLAVHHKVEVAAAYLFSSAAINQEIAMLKVELKRRTKMVRRCKWMPIQRWLTSQKQTKYG